MSIWEDAAEETQEVEQEISEEIEELSKEVEAKAKQHADAYKTKHASDAKITRDDGIKLLNQALELAKGWMVGKHHKDNQPHELVPCAFFLGTYGEMQGFPVSWEDANEKYGLFSALIQTAKKGYDHGVIGGFMAVLDARMKHLSPDESKEFDEGKKKFKDGEISDDKANPECLTGFLSMPNEKSYTVYIPYTRDEKGMPQFQEPQVLSDGEHESNLIPATMWEG